MPTARINGAEIYYEIVGQDGPWMAVMSAAREPLTVIQGLTRAIAARGYRVIVHDRRNCGRSSLDFDNPLSEEDVWVEDLHALLNLVGATPAFVIGTSRTSRVAMRFALRYPDETTGLGLWGLSGGAASARFLPNYYYGQYLSACNTGGMEAVCGLEYFASLIASRPDNKAALLAMDPQYLISVMSRWRDQFLIDIDCTVTGVSDSDLRMIGVPTAIVPRYDRAHPYAVALHVLETVPHCQLFDFDPVRRDGETATGADKFTDEPIVAALLCDFQSGISMR